MYLKIIFIISVIYSGLVFANETSNEIQNTMNHTSSKGMLHRDTKPYHHMQMIENYKVMVSSKKPLRKGINELTIVILKEKKPMKNLNVAFEISSSENLVKSSVTKNKNAYKLKVDFPASGHWMYKLTFVTHDNKLHTSTGRINIK